MISESGKIDLPSTKALEADFATADNNFWEALEGLPEELRLKWENEYNNIDEVTLDFFASFNYFLQARARAQGGFVEVHDDVDKEIRSEISLVHEVMQAAFNNKEEFFIGEGRTAEVFIFPFAPDICIKLMVRETGVDNTIAEEVDILNQLRGFVLDGVRVPTSYFRQVKTKDKHYYGMERVMGQDLFQIAQFPDKNLDFVKLAKSLDRNVVQTKLINFIDALYHVFKITHGDLRHGNVMLTEEGELVLIDFGKAKKEEIGEDMEERLRADKLILIEHLKIFFDAVDRFEVSS